MNQPFLSLLDRPIAFHRCYVTLSGSVNAGLLLSQAVYWSLRTTDPDGWFYKTREEWEAETGLTRTEQETARRLLRQIDVLEEKNAGLPKKLYFRINAAQLEELLLNLVKSTEGRIPASKRAGKPPTSRRASNQQVGVFPSVIPEITAEITQKNTTERPDGILPTPEFESPGPDKLSLNLQMSIPDKKTGDNELKELADSLVVAYVQELYNEYEENLMAYRHVDIEASRIGLCSCIYENPQKFAGIRNRQLYLRKWLTNERKVLARF